MRLPESAAHDAARAILDATRHPSGWRDPHDDPAPPEALDDVPDWFGERVAATEAGSYVAGVPPLDGTDAEYQAAVMVALPSVAAAVSRAVADDARITVLTEGVPYDPDSGTPPTDSSDMVAATVAGAVRVLGRAAAVYATWDDAPVNVYDPKSPVWERLTHAAGDLDTARAAIAARMMVLGATVEDLREVGILDARSSLKFEELVGRPVPKKVTDPIRRDLRSAVYPHEFGAEPTVVSALSDLYDSLRASNLLRKINDAEADGGVVIAVVPPWLGYALKPVVARLNERVRRKQASIDLEMAWGFNARAAAKIGEILRDTSPKITSGARSVTPKLTRANPANALWTYAVPGSKGEMYTVRIKGIPKGNRRNVVNMDVRVSCTCPFFRYQGPEHWAKVGDYLYGKPAGTAARPDQKDPDGRNRVCKHIAAVLARAGNLVYTPPKGRTAATTLVPSQFDPGEAGLMTRDEYLSHINKGGATHPSDAYDFTTFRLNEGFARRHIGTVTTRRGPVSVYQSTTGLVFTDEDGRAVAVLHNGTLYHEPRAFDIPDGYTPGPRMDPVTLGIMRRKPVKYVSDYVTLVDNLARRNADKYPVVLRRFVSAGEPMSIRAVAPPIPNKGTNLAVLDSTGRVVAVAENEWGATLIAVAREARGRGLGKVLARVWHDLNPGFDSGGMTSGGHGLMSTVWADRVREFMARGWYSQMIRDGRVTRARVDEILADLPGRTPAPAPPPTVRRPEPLVMSDGESYVTVYDRAVLDDPALLDDPDDRYIYGHAFLRDDPHVGTYVFSIDYDRSFADLTTRAILQLARDIGDRLYDGEGYHDILEGVDGIPGVDRDGDYIIVSRDLFPLRAAAAAERKARRAVDPHGEVEALIQERADAKWR
jgi:hypothetical protein